MGHTLKVKHIIQYKIGAANSCKQAVRDIEKVIIAEKYAIEKSMAQKHAARALEATKSSFEAAACAADAADKASTSVRNILEIIEIIQGAAKAAAEKAEKARAVAQQLADERRAAKRLQWAKEKAERAAKRQAMIDREQAEREYLKLEYSRQIADKREETQKELQDNAARNRTAIEQAVAERVAAKTAAAAKAAIAELAKAVAHRAALQNQAHNALAIENAIVHQRHRFDIGDAGEVSDSLEQEALGMMEETSLEALFVSSMPVSNHDELSVSTRETSFSGLDSASFDPGSKCIETHVEENQAAAGESPLQKGIISGSTQSTQSNIPVESESSNFEESAGDYSSSHLREVTQDPLPPAPAIPDCINKEEEDLYKKAYDYYFKYYVQYYSDLRMKEVHTSVHQLCLHFFSLIVILSASHSRFFACLLLISESTSGACDSGVIIVPCW